MPLPWLIGAAVVAAAAAVVKVVDDYNEEERRKEEEQEQERREKQEQKARLQQQHKNLTTQLANLKKDRLEAVYESLIRSAEVLEQSKKAHIIRPKSESPLLNGKVEATLSSTTQATSNYAQSMSAILSSSLPNQELQTFLVNLQALETLYGAISIDSALQKDLTRVREIRQTLHRLQNLKQQIEQQG